MSWFFYGVAAFSGLIVKLVDYIEDDMKWNSPAKYLLALFYGLLIGYTISFSTFSTLWLAVIFAQLVTGKIDNNSHILGFVTSIAFPAVFGIGEFNIFDFFIFFAFAALDEANPFSWPGANLRLSLKLVTLFFVLLGRWDYFIAIMSFDLAYLLIGHVFSTEKEGKPEPA